MVEKAETNPAEKAPLNKVEIIAKVQAMNFPAGSYVVFGSGPLAAAGIRPAGDIDILVSSALYEKLKKEGWHEHVKGPNDVPIVHDVFEAHNNWGFSPYDPTLESLLATANVIDGVPFASLEEVRKWKAASGGPKHLADVARIDEYLKNREQ